MRESDKREREQETKREKGERKGRITTPRRDDSAEEKRKSGPKAS